jgi:EmrB/QacA subfamily drug resistance transporter
VSAYILVFAGLLLTMGSLGDRFGRKRLLQVGLVLFGVASLAAAYSQTSGQLIAARAFMGVGAAMIMPSTLSVIIDVFPRHDRAKAIAIWAASAGLGVPLGMVLGGWLLESFWWGSAFLINIPIVLAVLVAGFALVPDSRDPDPRKIDVMGAILSTGSLSTLVYAIIQAPERGWGDPVVVAGFVVSALTAVAFVIYELRIDHPMLDMRFFRNARLSSGAIAISIAFLSLLGLIFITTQYLQFVRDYSPLQAGLRMVPLALGYMLGAGTSEKLVAALGTKKVVTGGLLLVGFALLSFVFVDETTAYWIVAAGMVAMGVGIGSAMAPATEAVMGAVPEANAGVGSALNDVTRNVGGALGIGILGSVLNSIYSSNVASAVTELPAGAAAAAKNSIGAAEQIALGLEGSAAESLRVAADSAFVDAMSIAMAVAAGIVITGAAIVLRFMPARELGVDSPSTEVGRPLVEDVPIGEVAPVPVPVRTG